MQIKRLQLKPGATLAEDGGRVGVTWNGRIQWARDGTQAALLRDLARNPLDLDVMCGEGPSPPGGMPRALTLAALILDFGDYLEP